MSSVSTTRAKTVRAPVQGRAHRTRATLVQAARDVFAELGYSGATAKRIAAAAGCATGTFYQYFSDKDAVLRELALGRAATLRADVLTALRVEPSSDLNATPGELEHRLSQVVAVVIRHHREDAALHAVVTERRHADAALDAEMVAGESALVDGIASLLESTGAAAVEGDTEALAFILFGMVEGAVHAHVLGTPRVSDDRFSAALTSAALRAAWPARGPRPSHPTETP